VRFQLLQEAADWQNVQAVWSETLAKSDTLSEGDFAATAANGPGAGCAYR
jgi:hypothetical protein